jgi:hypothetical protein
VLAGATTTGRDFALDPGGAISGTVTDLLTGAPLPFVSVYFYDSAGRFVTSGSTNATGAYMSSGGLAPGNYHAATMSSQTHANEAYDDLPCPGECTSSFVTRGTPIAVTAGVTTTGKNFVVQPRAGAPGAPLDVRAVTDAAGLWIYWTPPPSGGIATSFLLEAGLAPGTVAVSFPVADRRYFLTGVPPGRYYLRVRGINASGTGAASAEYTLVIGAGGAPPLAPRLLRAAMAGARLTLTWSVDFYGGEPTSYLIEAGSASGLANIAIIPATTRAFTYEPVPSGFYFLRVRAQNASGTSAASNEVMLVVGGVPAPPPAPVGLGSSVSGSTVTLAWIAPPGPVTGYVIEGGSASGLSNLATLPIGALTTMSFPGIPPGTYYVRIRAVNALGRGVASDEVTVVVG